MKDFWDTLIKEVKIPDKPGYKRSYFNLRDLPLLHFPFLIQYCLVAYQVKCVYFYLTDSKIRNFGIENQLLQFGP